MREDSSDALRVPTVNGNGKRSGPTWNAVVTFMAGLFWVLSVAYMAGLTWAVVDMRISQVERQRQHQEEHRALRAKGDAQQYAINEMTTKCEVLLDRESRPAKGEGK